MNRLTRIIVIGLLTLPVGSAFALPVGFSVNSDEENGDQLHQVDLSSGATQSRGAVRSATQNFSDVEGLAFDSNGTLWALDDQSLSLFPVSTGNGTVDRDLVAPVRGIDALSGNDFGMTFSCDGSLFVSSVAEGALFRLDESGMASRVGNLGANISALAAYGNPTRLYGLGNGILDDNGTPDNRSLYEIDTSTGTTRLIGTLGSAASAYYEAGLSFDDSGRLWAITDRNGQGQSLPSEILEIDPETGIATLVARTTGTGFESLAVAPPSGCSVVAPPPTDDGNSYSSQLPHIPTLDFYGKLASILSLLFVGLFVLRARP